MRGADNLSEVESTGRSMGDKQFELTPQDIIVHELKKSKRILLGI